jgi:hypothetical protein
MANTAFCCSSIRKHGIILKEIPYKRTSYVGITSRQLTASEEDTSFLCAEAVWLQRSGSFILGMKLDIQVALLSEIWGVHRVEVFVL